MLKEKFEILCQNFSEDEELIAELWEEIETAHSQTNRHYHTLEHLEHIYKELGTLGLSPLLEFAIFYHDIVYDVMLKDNEEQSALLCDKRLVQLSVPLGLREEIKQLIFETKTHESSSSANTLFLDADLAILGSENYEAYCIKVQKEYEIYDDTTYFTGRKKVLKHFLGKERIYLTQHFHDKYNKKARVNMLIEYNSLT